jgi:hypothetical protein
LARHSIVLVLVVVLVLEGKPRYVEHEYEHETTSD